MGRHEHVRFDFRHVDFGTSSRISLSTSHLGLGLVGWAEGFGTGFQIFGTLWNSLEPSGTFWNLVPNFEF